MRFGNIHRIHFVGIGGIGMSGIAEILSQLDFSISGSDMSESETTKRLREIGVAIAIGHRAENVENADVVVYSSAVAEDNAEIIAARERMIPVIKRAEMLAEVTRLSSTVAVAGSHGKTTTTSMVGMILVQAQHDPTIIVGGKLHAFGGTNARLGRGDFMVVEADEYDRSFLKLNPSVSILTTLEEEHMDIYADLDDIKRTFVEFLNKVPFYGFVALCIDDPNIQSIAKDLKRKIVTFGTSEFAEYRAVNIRHEQRKTTFDVHLHGEYAATMTIQVPGIYNVKNALGAIAATHQIGVSMDDIATALMGYEGAFRRFDVRGTVGDIMVVDDYAHHPTEVLETIKGVRSGWNKRIVCVFQPHTFTRTQKFSDDFGKAFAQADVFIGTGIYPAREKAIPGITGKLIVNAVQEHGQQQAYYVEEKNDVPAYLANIIQENDMVLFMGAGDIYKQIDPLLQLLNKGKTP